MSLTKMVKSKKYCLGCSDNFYNGNNPYGIKKCWHFETAKVVTRYKVGWWVPTLRDNFTKIKTYDCHNASGQYALYTEDQWR